MDLAQAGNLLVYGAQGSGADEFVATALYSLSSNYGAEELNLYIADLGQGALAPFVALPQCGGIVMQGDLDRMVNLFRLLEHEIDRRRKLLMPYGGSIEGYRSATGRALPRTVLVIVNLASFYELYAPLEDRLNASTRDGVRCGVHTIITATSAMTPRMRLKANFARVLSCFMNDENDYVTVFGRRPQVLPAHVLGRGVVEIDKEALEFQAASVAGEGASLSDVVRALAERLGGSGSAAPIPELPDRVTADDLPALCAGGARRNLEGRHRARLVLLRKSPYMLVLGNDAEGIGRYLRGMWEALCTSPEARVRAIDLEGMPPPSPLTAASRSTRTRRRAWCASSRAARTSPRFS